METLKVQLRVAAASLAAVVVCVIGVPQIAGSSVPASLALYVATAATGTSDCSSVANACALSTALAEITAGETIFLVTAGVEGTSSSYYSGGYSISTPGTSALVPVTIEPLPGLATAPILDGGGTQQVLSVGDLYLDLSGVTVQNGNGDAHEGGGIANSGGHLSISNALFSDNAAGSHQGGGIANYSSGHLSVSNTVFSDNSAGFGGAIANGSTGTGTLTVTNSTFSANTSVYHGGAIANGDGGSKVGQGVGNGTAAVTDSTFSSNHSSVGGAVANGVESASQGTLTVSGSTFSDDSAASGGAISNGDSSGTGNLTISDSTFSDNSADGDGGAIDNGDNGSTGTLTVSASTYSGNSATGLGGAIDSGAAGTNVDAVTVAADVFAEGCDEASGTWTDNGYNVGSDASCFSGGTGDDDSAGSNFGVGTV